MRKHMLWEAFWPWLYYEIITAFVWLLSGWYLGDMGVLLLSMPVSLLVLVPVYLYRKEQDRREMASFSVTGMDSAAGEKSGSVSYWCVLAVTAVSVCLLFNVLLFCLGAGRNTDSGRMVREVLHGAPYWLQILVTGLAAPLTEEVIYRGLSYGRLRKEMEFLPAAVLSSIFFGVAHGNLLQGIYTGILGLFLAYVYESGGLRAAIWFHIWANLMSLGMNRLFTVCPQLTENRWLLPVLLISGAAGTAAGIVWLRGTGSRSRKCRKMESGVENRNEESG